MQICGLRESARIVQELEPVNATEIKLVESGRSSVLNTEINPVENCLFWLCYQIAAVPSRFSHEPPIETWRNTAVADRDRSCLEFFGPFCGHASQCARRLRTNSVFAKARLKRDIGILTQNIHQIPSGTIQRKPVVVDLIADMLHQFSPLLARERLRYSSRNDAVLMCQFIRAKDGAGLRFFANRGYPIHIRLPPFLRLQPAPVQIAKRLSENTELSFRQRLEYF